MENIQNIMNYYATCKTTGRLGLGFKNFKTGQEYYIRGDERFPAASAFKLPVLIELFAQKEQGKLSLSQYHTFAAEDYSPGSGVLHRLTPGLSMSLNDYAHLMMMLSDNTATDILFNLLGKENIKNRIMAMGLENTRSDLSCRELILGLYKGIPLNITKEEYIKLFESSEPERDDTLKTNFTVPNDISSPKDTVEMYSMLLNHQILTPASCEAILDILAKCQTNSRIPYHLPGKGENDATVMHKTGTLNNVAVDAGIVKTSTNCYSVAFFYDGFYATEKEKETPHFANYLLADLSLEIFNALHKIV